MPDDISRPRHVAVKLHQQPTLLKNSVQLIRKTCLTDWKIIERRVAYLESQLKVVRQQPLTMQQLYKRRQEKLDYYRQQYEGPQYVRVKQTKHILLFT